MDVTSHLKSNALQSKLIGIDSLKKLTDQLFPTDTDLPFWMWKILLRDMVFFRLVYPGWKIAGCEFELEVRHVVTGQTRDEWLADIDHGFAYDVFDLLNPWLWLIGVESLKAEYHKLFVYYPDWQCPDAVNHHKWTQPMSHEEAERHLDSMMKPEQRPLWKQQVRVQGINPCVYSMLRWWMVADPQLNR